MSKRTPKMTDSLDPGSVFGQSIRRLSPKDLARNPVMMVVGTGTLITFLLGLSNLAQGKPAGLDFAICAILLFTVLFANGAESVAEARGKAQAGALRATRKDLKARKLDGEQYKEVAATDLRRGDRVLVKPNELIPADGEIVTGAATINESAVTGESAPVLREARTDNSGVSAGTKVLSDEIVVEVTVDPGNSLLDRMIALVEGAKRQKTPSELALSVLLAAMTLVFLIVVVTLVPFGGFVGATPSFSVLVALLVCLIPTTIGGLLPAIGIAGMDRAMRANVIAKSGKAVEVAGSIDTLLLDKTGTITLGDRKATAFEAVQGVAPGTLRDAALLTSLADPTPEGKSVVALARDKGSDAEASEGTEFIEFSANTRMSGVDLPDGRILRKGATDAIRKFVTENGGNYPQETDRLVDRVAKNGATPLVVSEGNRVLGVIALSDVIKSGIKERFAKLREMGVKTVMITGDNPVTAAAIAAEAGVDDFVAEATPEQKLDIIRKEQDEGRMVAMMGDGTNDAPALAQADLGLAMNSGTQAAREAGNMVDLDSDPGKLLEVVEIGKQLLITRGSLTTFSLANDVAKYFAILPALFVTSLPALDALNVLDLANPVSAVLAATIFNALIIPALIPFALKGIQFKPASATQLLRRNLLIFGLGGLLLPFAAIKALDLMLTVVI
ncbi:K+-transporting ATPase ATPase B chain [Marinobacter persicus]|uniref:Potassium-transporting ATPase ATP-binding subunit n=2 Tax=Marinobacter persicus TaxID=930118 RepID=A0A2S6G8S4_9GAMM|nr:MAG: K+-transporting ATPase ATPase B chain [Marinobacter sp. T13-3]PPK52601.1 K+-transporting ATPase ATPase B chain [Marinobacter persicus]PPK55574.1 K+-transporting ATPase ATPase B chain [Marinobacter persicus]PPK58436.1 K+-transporting ATPase ATPase B chain [Marinobacter persicus]